MTVTATRAGVPVRTGVLTGTRHLIWFILRRDRIRLPVWIGAISLFVVSTTASLPGLYATRTERQARAELIANPGIRAFSGPGYGLDDYTFGAMLAQEFLSWTAIFVALMSFLLVVRHTRAEEETGRAELVRAAAAGRQAQPTAALIVVGGANVLLGALLALGLGSLGLAGISWSSSWLFGAALASIGVVFAAVAAVTAQLSQTARGAGGFAGAVFAVAYLVRAGGDMAETGGGLLSWLSPIGWAQQTRMYVEDCWWPLLLAVALAVALIAVSWWLSGSRDVGGAMTHPRPGRASAGPGLTGPVGLAWRLHRASVLWWGAALFLFGLGYGSLAAEIERFVGELSALDDWMASIGGQTMIDSFLAVIVMLMAITVAVFAVLTVTRPRSEETAGRVESVLAAAVARSRWLASHIIVAVVGSTVLLAMAGVGLGITAGAALDDGGMLARLLGAALAYAPAVWVTVALGVALFGLVPRASVLVWIVIAYAGTVGYLADLVGLPDWVIRLSPFSHVPLLPAEEIRWTPLLILTLVGVGLTWWGLAAFRRRDIQSP